MEADLPVLLDRILPRLTLPSDRLAQVRRRVRQRRRRRRAAATASALAVGCAVVGTVLWPAAFGPGHRATPDVPSAASREYAPVRLQAPLEGVTMYLPTTWHGLSLRDGYGTAAGFVSSQALRSPGTGRCSRITDAVVSECPPLAGLDTDGVLITFLRSEAGGSGDAVLPTRGVLVPADEHCRLIGGDAQMTGSARNDAANSVEGPDIRIDVCLRKPSEETLSTVDKILTLAFSARGR
ncbi:hypothetical protein [Streptomyces sp. NPDC026673]|uniref:hypothetical protein n=1 Tax=Streptomyces sp. NPDC026673 TaxID=3155724 RepID=UPI003404A2C3